MKHLTDNELLILGSYLEDEMFHPKTSRLGERRGDHTSDESYADMFYIKGGKNWEIAAFAYDSNAKTRGAFGPYPCSRVCCKLASMYLRGNGDFNRDLQKAAEYISLSSVARGGLVDRTPETLFSQYMRILFDLGLVEGIEADYDHVRMMEWFRFFIAIPHSLGGARLQLYAVSQSIHYLIERGAIATARQLVVQYRIFAKRYARRFNTCIYDELLQEESFADVDALYERYPRFISK